MKKEYVLGFAIDLSAEQVLLIHKTKDDWQKGKLNGLGGKIEEEDSLNRSELDKITHAMEREFYEESGMEIPFFHEWYPYAFLSGENFLVNVCFAYVQYNPNYKFISNEGEVSWYSMNPLPNNVIPNLYWLVNSLKDKEVRNSLVNLRGYYI